MGARPIALLDGLRFGPRSWKVERAVAGIGHYGNCVGVPTVGGELILDPAYEDNCLVNAMCVGLLPASRVTRARASAPGLALVAYGATTGRDGIGGASMLASAELGEEDADKRPSVQIGDPFTGKRLIEVSLELVERGLVESLQDCGAAGLASSLAEMARDGTGVDVHLDRVPLREPGMEPWEIMISESQERMVAAVSPERVPEVVARDRALGAGVGRDRGRHRHGRAPRLSRRRAPGPDRRRLPDRRVPALRRRAQAADGRRSDSPSAGDARCALGLRAVRPARRLADGAPARLRRCRAPPRPVEPRPGRLAEGPARRGADPFLAGALAVLRAARNVACAGGEPLALTDCLNFGNPERPEIAWELEQAIEGIAQAAEALGIPVVSGNVSLYNETDGRPIPPTPVVGCVGLVPDVRNVPRGWQRGDAVYAIRRREPLDLAHEADLIRFLVEIAPRCSLVHDVSDGDLDRALAEAGAWNGVSVDLAPSGTASAIVAGTEPVDHPDAWLVGRV